MAANNSLPFFRLLILVFCVWYERPFLSVPVAAVIKNDETQLPRIPYVLHYEWWDCFWSNKCFSMSILDRHMWEYTSRSMLNVALDSISVNQVWRVFLGDRMPTRIPTQPRFSPNTHTHIKCPLFAGNFRSPPIKIIKQNIFVTKKIEGEIEREREKVIYRTYSESVHDSLATASARTQVQLQTIIMSFNYISFMEATTLRHSCLCSIFVRATENTRTESHRTAHSTICINLSFSKEHKHLLCDLWLCATNYFDNCTSW